MRKFQQYIFFASTLTTIIASISLIFLFVIPQQLNKKIGEYIDAKYYYYYRDKYKDCKTVEEKVTFFKKLHKQGRRSRLYRLKKSVFTEIAEIYFDKEEFEKALGLCNYYLKTDCKDFHILEYKMRVLKSNKSADSLDIEQKLRVLFPSKYEIY